MPDNFQQAIQSSLPTLPPSTPIPEAINIMAEAKASCVLIAEERKLMGIFTERDIVSVTTSRISLYDLTLADLMTRDLITLKASEIQDIFTVSLMFNRHKTSCITFMRSLNLMRTSARDYKYLKSSLIAN